MSKEIEIIDLCDSSDDEGGGAQSALFPPTADVYDVDLQLALSLSQETMTSVSEPARKKSKADNGPRVSFAAPSPPIFSPSPRGGATMKSERCRHSTQARFSDVTVVAPPGAPTIFAATVSGNEDDDMIVVGSKNAVILPHMRCHCTTHPFNHTRPNEVAHKASCSMCYCYVCDVKVSECKKWSTHFRASDRSSEKRWDVVEPP